MFCCGAPQRHVPVIHTQQYPATLSARFNFSSTITTAMVRASCSRNAAISFGRFIEHQQVRVAEQLAADREHLARVLRHPRDTRQPDVCLGPE